MWTLTLELKEGDALITLQFKHDDEAYAALMAMRSAHIYQADLINPAGTTVKIAYGKRLL